jgi:hypothetical protein
MLPTQIHHGNMVVSGEAWRLFKETHPERYFSHFDLSSFFLFHEDYSATAAASSSSKLLKTEPLSPITT